jgi:hypothetical protein
MPGAACPEHFGNVEDSWGIGKGGGFSVWTTAADGLWPDRPLDDGDPRHVWKFLVAFALAATAVPAFGQANYLLFDGGTPPVIFIHKEYQGRYLLPRIPPKLFIDIQGTDDEQRQRNVQIAKKRLGLVEPDVLLLEDSKFPRLKIIYINDLFKEGSVNSSVINGLDLTNIEWLVLRASIGQFPAAVAGRFADTCVPAAILIEGYVFYESVVLISSDATVERAEDCVMEGIAVAIGINTDGLNRERLSLAEKMLRIKAAAAARRRCVASNSKVASCLSD